MTLAHPAGCLGVLIDGAYALDPRGTGISTYSRTLAAALKRLGHSTAWLSGAPAPRRTDVLVDAAISADDPVETRGLRRNLATLANMTGGVLSVPSAPRRIRGGVSTPSSGSQCVETWLVPNLFVHAHYRHMLLRKFTRVSLPTGFDVMHLTAPLPLRPLSGRLIVTVHDLVPIRLPWATPDDKREFVARVRQACQIADIVITVSEASKADIVQLLGVDPDRIAVTYQPTELVPLSRDDAGMPRVLERFGLEQGAYALFVGAIEPKKNLRRLIEAFLETDSSLPLAIVGKKAWMWEREIGELEAALGGRARHRLRWLGYVAQQDLAALYAGAQMFMFPALNEGFGLPALEALQAGTPVLAARAGSLPELCGDAAVYVDPLDRGDIRKGIERLMSDASLRARLSVDGQAQASRFTMDAYVERLGGAYARLLR